MTSLAIAPERRHPRIVQSASVTVKRLTEPSGEFANSEGVDSAN